MASGVAVTVVLPGMLAAILGEERLQVRAATIEEAMEAAYERIPVLRHHLSEPSGRFRTHILCLLNGVSTRRQGSLQSKLEDGDEIRIVQAISGG